MKLLRSLFCLLIMVPLFLQAKVPLIKTHFVGEYVLSRMALYGYQTSDNPDTFGIFNIDLEKSKVQIPDSLYPVINEFGDEVLGMIVLPVSDKNDEIGFKVVDDYLLKEMYGDDRVNEEHNNIFSPIIYFHPEINSATFSKLGDALRTEGGMTHAGAYIGLGRARNAPVDYHEKKWDVYEDGDMYGYPAHVYKVGLKGVDQKIINNNILVALRILNGHHGGPKFPDDYKFDYFRTYNLKEVLDFYRAWIDPEFAREDINEVLGLAKDTPYIYILLNREEFSTYCNEHITIAINLGLNLVQTRQGYIDVWGEVGSTLFDNAKKIFSEVTKMEAKEEGIGTAEEIPEDLLAKFQRPLWKRKINLRDGEYLYNQDNIEELGWALAWKPETTFDLLSNFIKTYADFTKVTIVRSTFAILSFAKESYKRLGLHPEVYNALALKFIQGMMKTDIRYRATTPLPNGVVIASLPKTPEGKEHPGKKIFIDGYFEKIKGPFVPLYKETTMRGGIALKKKEREGMIIKRGKLLLKIAQEIDPKEKKKLNDEIDELKEKIEEARLTIVTLKAQIKLIPAFKSMLAYVKSTASNLIKRPLEVDVKRKTIQKLLTKKIRKKIERGEELSLEEKARFAFSVSVNKDINPRELKKIEAVVFSTEVDKILMRVISKVKKVSRGVALIKEVDKIKSIALSDEPEAIKELVLSIELEDISRLAFWNNVEEKRKSISFVELAKNIKPKDEFSVQLNNDKTFVQYYSPPSIIHRIALGNCSGVDSEFFIDVLGTAFGAGEVENVK